MEKKFFNATKEIVEKKENNIFIGISLGVLKPLTEDMAKGYLDWALKNTKGKVAILIADEISKFNYRIFSSYSENKAQKRAKREGNKYFEFFKKLIKKFPQSEQDKIRIIRWKDIFDKKKEFLKEYLRKEYFKDENFKNKIRFFIKEYSKKRGKILTEEQLNYLSQYILYELPTLFEGIEFQKEKYLTLLYPTFESSGLSELVIKIEKGELFPNLKEKLNLSEKAILVETYISPIIPKTL